MPNNLSNDRYAGDSNSISQEQIASWNNGLSEIKVKLANNTNNYNNIIKYIEEELVMLRVGGTADGAVTNDLQEKPNIYEMQIPHNININQFAEDQLHTTSLLGL